MTPLPPDPESPILKLDAKALLDFIDAQNRKEREYFDRLLKWFAGGVAIIVAVLVYFGYENLGAVQKVSDQIRVETRKQLSAAVAEELTNQKVQEQIEKALRQKTDADFQGAIDTVAISRVFGTALAGNCQKRPELVEIKLPIEAIVEVIRSRGGADVLRRLFEPLGYKVEISQIPLDENFPEWGTGDYFRLSLGADITVHDLLTHLYVLLPVLDEEKHYYIGDAEVDKLLRHGEGWLVGHPERNLIVSRYLKRRRSLTDQAFARLLDQEVGEVEATETWTETAARAEKDLERPMTLHTHRLNQVATTLKELEAKSVLDLGCGESN